MLFKRCFGHRLVAQSDIMKIVISIYFLFLVGCSHQSASQKENDEVMDVGVHRELQLKTCDLEVNCECPIPGITSRWRANFCLRFHETDDFQNEHVQACINEKKSDYFEGLTSCQKNAYWRERACAVYLKGELEDYKKCMKDSDEYPGIVRYGP